MPLCFRRGKLPTSTPSPTRPPVRPSPSGDPSAGTPSNQLLALEPGQPLRNRKRRGSRMGQGPHPGRRVFPHHHHCLRRPHSALPAPGGHLSGRRKGLSAGVWGHLPVRVRGRRQGQGRAGRLPGAGAARSAVNRARSRSSSRAGTPGALLRRLLPAPTPGAQAPPRSESPALPPPRRWASPAAPSPALCVGARRVGAGARGLQPPLPGPN